MEEYQRTLYPKIRKITIGELNMPTAITYAVTGKPMNHDGLIITRIERDENQNFIFGNIEYQVYAKREENGEEFMWKMISGHKVNLEFFSPDTKKDEINAINRQP